MRRLTVYMLALAMTFSAAPLFAAARGAQAQAASLAGTATG
jgi:hypothetical protein